MGTQQKLPTIDADAHVVETEHTWDYIEPSDRKYRPRLYSCPEEPTTQSWVIDGKIRGFRFPTLSEMQLAEMSRLTGRNVETPEVARQLDDVELRLQHMDSLGIDVQVLHNTLWIVQVSDRPEVEVVLCRSWNRWLADIWKQAKGRLRWSCVLPLMSKEDALVEMKIAKENGAVAVCMRPIEGNRLLIDPYFYPIYEEASRLNLAIAVHQANGNPSVYDVLHSPYDPGSFFAFRLATVLVCHSLIMSDLPRVFPNLRWAFIEAAAQWVPWVLREAESRFKTAGKPLPEDVLQRYKIYITCQTNDDLPYIIQQAGEDNFVIGTDYGHIDAASDLDAITLLKKMDIPQEYKDKILHHNPKTLYGL